MTLFIFGVLFFLYFLARIKSHKSKNVLAGAMTVFAIGILFGIVPGIMLTQLQDDFSVVQEPAMGARNAIVVLGAGNTKRPGEIVPTPLGYTRIFRAAQLYYGCKKLSSRCTVIASGGDPAHLGVSEAAIYENQLKELGIPKADIIIEPDSKNTYQNAQFTSGILNEKHYDRIFLTTSGFHMKRSRMFFKYQGIEVIPVIAEYMKASGSPFFAGYNIFLTDVALHEYGGMIKFFFYEFFHLNSKRQ